MEDWVGLLANANDSIVETWALFITINTATVGWILSKKGKFSTRHVWAGTIAYALFAFSMSQLIEVRYQYRNALLNDLKSDFSIHKEKTEYPYVVVKNRKAEPSALSTYVLNKETEYKLMTYTWLFVGWLLIAVMFVLDSLGEFENAE